MYLRNYGPQKAWLDKCLKSCLLDSTFIIFIDYCKENLVGKKVSLSHM